MATNTKRFRSFSSAPEVAADGTTPQEAPEPLGFELNGESFEVFPDCPGALLLEFIDTVEGGSGAGALLKLIQSVMAPEEWARLDKVLKDPEVVVDIKTIAAIVQFLVEEYAGRPTTAS